MYPWLALNSRVLGLKTFATTPDDVTVFVKNHGRNSQKFMFNWLLLFRRSAKQTHRGGVGGGRWLPSQGQLSPEPLPCEGPR